MKRLCGPGEGKVVTRAESAVSGARFEKNFYLRSSQKWGGSLRGTDFGTRILPTCWIIEPDYRILEVCQCLCEGARGTLHLC